MVKQMNWASLVIFIVWSILDSHRIESHLTL
jgi:hypothetical protein